MPKTLTVVIGAPCSGKTLYIQNHILPNSPAGIELFDLKNLHTLGRIIRYLKAAAWEKKEEIIVEGFFPNPRSRRLLIEFAHNNDYVPKVIFINSTLEQCLAWNKKRDEINPGTGTPTPILRKAFASMEKPTYYEGFASVTEIIQKEEEEEVKVEGKEIENG